MGDGAGPIIVDQDFHDTVTRNLNEEQWLLLEELKLVCPPWGRGPRSVQNAWWLVYWLQAKGQPDMIQLNWSDTLAKAPELRPLIEEIMKAWNVAHL